jgi:4-amino-4-deoxy-L-arabinose transferase-like glycosyltransferase
MQQVAGIGGRRTSEMSARFRAHVTRRFVVCATLVVAIAIFGARAATTWDSQPITSDESLYLSEAVAIAHGHLTYSSGDPIIHRPPLYPATLAPLMKISGNDLAVARTMPALYAAGALVALFLLACVLFDSLTGAVAVLFAAAAAYPARLSTAFFVDTPAAMWALAAAAALAYGLREGHRTARWCGIAGLLLGLSFLTKETAVFWLPLPVLLALFDRPTWTRVRWSGLIAWCAGAAVCIVPWFIWTALQTGRLYKLPLVARTELAVTGTAALLVITLIVVAVRRSHLSLSGRASGCAGLALLAASSAISLFVLELRPEPQPVDYLRTVPSWLVHVFGSSVEPAPLIALAWLYLLWRAVRGESGARLLALCAVLSLPLLIFVANRDWEPRQIMPVVYISYLVLAWALLDAGAKLSARWSEIERQIVAGALVAGLAFTAGFVSQLNAGQGADPGSAAILDWSAQPERAASQMLDRLPSGAVVLSSRLYYSQLYIDQNARITVRQLPTLGVRIGAAPAPVRPFGTLFRYEDASTNLAAPRQWISLREYATSDYAIGLAEGDLIASIDDHHAGYVLLSGDDAGFSSLSDLAYFQDNPAFRLVDSVRSPDVSSYLFAVDRTKLAPQRRPLALTMQDFAYIDHAVTDGSAGSAAFWRRLAPYGVQLDGGAEIDANSAALIVRDLRAGAEATPRR